VKRNWAAGEVMDIVRGHGALYDCWSVPLGEVDSKWSPIAEENAEGKRERLVRAIVVILQQARFAKVEQVRKVLVLGVHTGPVTKTEDIFKAVSELLDEDMLQAIELECTAREHASVREFFGKPM